MKKFILSLILVCVLFLPGCQETISGEDELIKKAAENAPIANAKQTKCNIMGSCDLGENELIWFCFGNEYQAKTYLPVEFEKADDDKYVFVCAYEPRLRGEDIACEELLNGYSFLINNPDCKYIELIDTNNKTKLIEIRKIPFVYYFNAPIQEYNFLDNDKNIIEAT